MNSKQTETLTKKEGGASRACEGRGFLLIKSFGDESRASNIYAVVWTQSLLGANLGIAHQAGAAALEASDMLLC